MCCGCYQDCYEGMSECAVDVNRIDMRGWISVLWMLTGLL